MSLAACFFPAIRLISCAMRQVNFYHRLSILLGLSLPILLCSALPGCCGEMSVAWDANSEPDLEGYGIYFKDIPDSEYSLYGYVALQELADPEVPRFVVSGLEKGKTYYFAGTAYNRYGQESGFSNSICVEVGDSIAACSSSEEGSGEDSGSSSGGDNGSRSSSGGGGGGCFINSVF
jgi:uncharacterized membrane protein YgcG